MKQKSVSIPDDLFERLTEEKNMTTIPANAIIVLALRQYLNCNEVDKYRGKKD